jgi:hypothetical protein
MMTPWLEEQFESQIISASKLRLEAKVLLQFKAVV